MINVNIFGSDSKLRNMFTLGTFFVRQNKLFFLLGMAVIAGLIFFI